MVRFGGLFLLAFTAKTVQTGLQNVGKLCILNNCFLVSRKLRETKAVLQTKAFLRHKQFSDKVKCQIQFKRKQDDLDKSAEPGHTKQKHAFSHTAYSNSASKTVHITMTESEKDQEYYMVN